MPHQGRYPSAYHEYVLEQMKNFDSISKGDSIKFLKLFNQIEGGNRVDKKELDAVVKLPTAKRYEYFIKKVADFEEVWGLYNDGWATTKDDNGNTLIPFWPKREFAQFCASDEWKNYAPEKIDLYEFIEEWLPGIKEDGYKPSIFSNNYDSAIVEIDILLRDLNLELENY